jgi:hypothetical protein
MRVLIILSLCLIFSCNKKQNLSNFENVTNFDWLLNQWQRSNDKAGQATFENWDKTNDSLYIGMSYTLQGADTVFKENVQLVRTGNQWSYNVLLSDADEGVSFVITQMSDASFICENMFNEFPKKFLYQMKGDSLFANVSGGEHSIDYWFGKTLK